MCENVTLYDESWKQIMLNYAKTASANKVVDELLLQQGDYSGVSACTQGNEGVLRNGSDGRRGASFRLM